MSGVSENTKCIVLLIGLSLCPLIEAMETQYDLLESYEDEQEDDIYVGAPKDGGIKSIAVEREIAMHSEWLKERTHSRLDESGKKILFVPFVHVDRKYLKKIFEAIKLLNEKAYKGQAFYGS